MATEQNLEWNLCGHQMEIDGDRVHIGFHESSKVTCLFPRVPAAEHLIPLSHLLNNTPQVTLDTQYITITFKITLIT